MSHSILQQMLEEQRQNQSTSTSPSNSSSSIPAPPNNVTNNLSPQARRQEVSSASATASASPHPHHHHATTASTTPSSAISFPVPSPPRVAQSASSNTNGGTNTNTAPSFRRQQLEKNLIRLDLEAQRRMALEKLANLEEQDQIEKDRARSASQSQQQHSRAGKSSGSKRSASAEKDESFIPPLPSSSSTSSSANTHNKHAAANLNFQKGDFAKMHIVEGDYDPFKKDGGNGYSDSDSEGYDYDDDENEFSDDDTIQALEEHVSEIEAKITGRINLFSSSSSMAAAASGGGSTKRKVSARGNRPSSKTNQRNLQYVGGAKYVPEIHRQTESEQEKEEHERIRKKKKTEELNPSDPEEAALLKKFNDQNQRISTRSELIQRACENGVPLAHLVSKSKMMGRNLSESFIDTESAQYHSEQHQLLLQNINGGGGNGNDGNNMSEPGSPAGLGDEDYNPKNIDASSVMGSSFAGSGALMQQEQILDLMDRFRTTGVRDRDVAALIQDICLPGAVDLILPDPHRFIASRIGDMLSSLFILKRDVFSATARPDFVGVMGGAPLFRMVPKFNIGAVSQPHSSGIRTILNEVAVEWGGKCCWVNLRDDPHIFLNQRSYSLRRHESPAEPVVTTGILSHRIEAMEDKLRREVVAESTRRGGNVIVHREVGASGVESQWEAVDEETVMTTEQLFKHSQCRSHANYIRLPFSARDISLARLDDIYKLCLQYKDDPLIFCCQTGRGRSTFATILACIIRFYQHQAKGLETRSTVLNTIGRYNAQSLSLLNGLVQVLPEGHKHERRVCLLAQVTGASSNFLDRMFMSFKSDRGSGTGRSLLHRYLHLIAFSRYCEEQLVLKYDTEVFSSWIARNTEVSAVIRQCGVFVIESHHDGDQSQATEEAATILGALKCREKNEALTLATALVPEVERLEERHPAIPGVFALRHPDERVPVLSTGHMTESGLSLLLKTFCKMYDWVGVLYIVDVRAEPNVYIGGKSYALLDAKSLVEKATRTSVTMNASKLERLESQVAIEAKSELDTEGVIIAHTADHSGTVSEVRLKANTKETSRIQTSRDFFESFDKFTVNIRYVRVPIAHHDVSNIRDCCELIKNFFKIGDSSGVVIVDSDGCLRSTMAMNAAMLVRASLYRPISEITTEHDLRLALAHRKPASSRKYPTLSRDTFLADAFGDQPAPEHPSEKSIELLVASQLAQMLAAGTMLGFTECVVSLCGRGNCWNALDAISNAKDTWQRATGNDRESWLKKTFSYVRLYLGVLLMATYVDRSQRNEVDTDFEGWLDLNTEIDVAIEKAHEHPKTGLKFVLPQNLYLETQAGSVSRRKGNVLTANFGLKADHFPGAIRKLSPNLPGVPNFRKVAGVNVYGVAIPTVRGIFNLLRLVGSAPGNIEPNEPSETLDPVLFACHPRTALFHPTPDALTNVEHQPRPKRGRVIWVNLREEPLLYIGDRPFVFRDLATPYVNVEFTGITTEKVESIENILREDVLAEAKAHNNKFLIHDEIEAGRMGGLWESAKPEQINTVRQLYETAAHAGCRVEFVRLPVTDEQTPETEDFDSLVRNMFPDILKSATLEGESLSFVFNCQMGRGRTTTGMVICCMLIGLVRNHYYDWLDDIYPGLYPDGASEFANGNYRMIRALSRCLLDYRDAKHRVDLVLEACSKMQNLRTAVEIFKNQLESPETTEEGRMRAFHHGVHYLNRYFYLIVFNSYLHEEYDPYKRVLKSTFKEWLSAHHEVVKLTERADLK